MIFSQSFLAYSQGVVEKVGCFLVFSLVSVTRTRLSYPDVEII
jgi:hypothetical protein